MAKLLPLDASSPETALAEVSERTPGRGAGMRSFVRSLVWAIRVNRAVRAAPFARERGVAQPWLDQLPS